MKYYIADLHFGHDNIIRFDDRPYDSVESMEEELINNWNKAVKSEDDEVYILGDFSWENTEKTHEILDKLNGKKYLILGNHDTWVTSESMDYLEDIQDLTTIKDEALDGRRFNVFLSHYPIPLAPIHRKDNGMLLYGHVHGTIEHEYTNRMFDMAEAFCSSRAEHFNVGALMPYINYTPRTLDEILLEGRKHRIMMEGQIED